MVEYKHSQKLTQEEIDICKKYNETEPKSIELESQYEGMSQKNDTMYSIVFLQSPLITLISMGIQLD
jgi:hypothetical protein